MPLPFPFSFIFWKEIAADERAYERTVRNRTGFAQQERSETEAFNREKKRLWANNQLFGKKVPFV